LATTWQFSTVVEPLSLEELQTGTVTTTGGTAIASVLKHALNQDDVASIVIVSDGYVEDVETSVKRQLEERGITVESVISDSGNSSPLDELGRVTKLDRQ
jgi:uncharacterized protein with von Willebrand factor type A (vWA) domain